jgi:hypothetical protein
MDKEHNQQLVIEVSRVGNGAAETVAWGLSSCLRFDSCVLRPNDCSASL